MNIDDNTEKKRYTAALNNIKRTVGLYMDRKNEKNDFIKECAISAMQGIQESGKLGIALDILPNELAKLSFDIAERMWEEYDVRKMK